MEEQPKSTAGQGFGIAALILGILALLIAFIPCVGLFALIPGVIAIVLAIVGLSQATSANGAKGLIITALVISIIGTMLASAWLIFFSAGGAILDELRKNPDFKEVIEEVINDIKIEIHDNIDDSLDDVFEDTETKDLEETLDALEKGDEDIPESDLQEPDTIIQNTTKIKN